MNKLFVVLLALLFAIEITATTPVGGWSDYLPYKSAIKVVAAGSKIYCCTANSLFYYNVTDKSINKISKIQGLNDVGISTIAYDSTSNSLIIAYANSNIDIIQKNKIINLPYIKNKTTFTDRLINEICTFKGIAYLSCGFGIAVLDLKKSQFKDTYYPSTDGSVNKVNDVCTDGNYIYAATANGIFRGQFGDNLLVDYSHWTQMQNYNSECNEIKYMPGRIFALFKNTSQTIADSLISYDGSNWSSISVSSYNKKITSINTIYDKAIVVAGYDILEIDKKLAVKQIGTSYNPSYATIDINRNIWVSDKVSTLLEFGSGGDELLTVSPDSPLFPDVFKVDGYNGNIWTVAGAPATAWNGWTYNNHGAESFTNNTWQCYYAFNTTILNPLRDMVNVKIDPKNPNRVFIASWGWGLIEYLNGNFTILNSNLQPWIYDNIVHRYQIAGLSFDSNGNLWCTSAQSKKGLNVLTTSGNWYSFSINNNPNITYLLAASTGQLWMAMASSTQIVVYDYNSTLTNTSDDVQTSLNLSSVSSLITPNNIYSFAEDKSGNIWIGTDAGPVRISDPANVKTEGATSAAKILVPIVKGQSAATYLLETEKINAIAVDGGDRKWFGTQNSGVYLVSSDGTTVISHFSAENSPLFSNTIFDISIDQKTGEVYFATDKGLIGYRGNAIEGGENFGKVYVYPNPVRPEYNGDIYITGLISDADVKITDIAGNLVFETNSLGGQAVWNGKNLLNKRVNTGIYLVFCSSKDGSKTHVTKLLFVH